MSRQSGGIWNLINPIYIKEKSGYSYYYVLYCLHSMADICLQSAVLMLKSFSYTGEKSGEATKNTDMGGGSELYKEKRILSGLKKEENNSFKRGSASSQEGKKRAMTHFT